MAKPKILNRIANCIFVIILLVATTGITCHYHYCCDTLIKYSFLHTPEPCCEHPESCCHDEALTVQMKTDYVFTADLPDLSTTCMEIPVLLNDIEIAQYFEPEQPIQPEQYPPPNMSLRLSLLQQYLI